MNWTEGNLARHSRGKSAKNEVLKRQKQHFAKARSRLLNGGSRQSPVTISFMDTPIARQPPAHVNPSGHVDIFSDRDQHHPSLARVGSNTSRGQHHHHSRVEEHGRHGPFTAKPEVSRGEPSAKRTATRKAEATLESASREKRRKLLDKTDWAGLTMQQPLELTFPGQIRAGRTWNNTDQSELNTGKSRDALRERLAKRGRSRHFNNDGNKNLQPAERIKVQVGSQDTYMGNVSSPLSIRKRPTAAGIGRPIEICTDGSDLSHTPTRRSDLARQRRKSSLHSIHEQRLKERDNRRSSPREFRTPPGATTSSKVSSETSSTRVAFASAPIIQPAPLRADPFHVLRWSPAVSVSSGSLDVEIGQPRFRPDAVDIADNEKWKTLVDSSDHLIPLTRGSSLLNSPHIIPVLSPGISEMLTRRENSCAKFIGSAHAQVGESTPPETRCSLAANAATGDCDSDPPAVQPPPKSQAVSLEMRKREGAKTPNDIDENMTWMKFLFDSDGDDFERRAIQEAAQLAARKIRPSESPEEISTTNGTRRKTKQAGGTEPSSENSQSSRCMVARPDVHEGASLEGSDGIASTTVTSASRIATHGSVDSSDSTHNQHLEAGITCNGVDDTTLYDSPPLESETSAMNTVISDVETTGATKATSDNSERSQDLQRTYRFAAPQGFVGKHAHSDKLRGVQMPPPHTAVGSKRRGRRKKALDGRMSIRELPNFDGDPIEDIEED
ncbi:hypothetical protein PGQ11_005174 [Apiospora arundinis]|uniref:Uncharacterized protein n=1 Tax=Apiospora arundinis TaxID=335852 RepID=A0ABR2JBM3_9PEZI